MRKLPPLFLEKLALNELRPAERDRIDAALAKDAQAAALAEIAQSNAEILAALPADAAARDIERRLGSTSTQRSSPWRYSGVLALAASLLLLVFWRVGRPVGEGQGPDTILKGDAPHLLIYRRTAQDYERLRAGAAVTAGDLLQIRYVAGGKRYGVIVSVDGRGEAALHFPAESNGATALKPGGEIALAFSYQLDDAPGFERFLFVTSDEPLDVGGVLAAARRLAASRGATSEALDLPQNSMQFSFLMRK